MLKPTNLWKGVLQRTMSQLQQRTMQEFRERGYIVGSVERRKRFPARGKPKCRACGSQPMVDISHDLWNVFDLIACRPKVDKPGVVVLVQSTSTSNHATRRTKILTSSEARFWLLSGGRICIQSWRKVSNRWQASDEWIGLEQFPRSMPATVEQFYEQQRKSKLSDYPPEATLLREPITDESIPF